MSDYSTQGVVVGGWPYVIAAYSITTAVLAAYAYSLIARLRRVDEEEEPSS